MPSDQRQLAVRLAAFEFLRRQQSVSGEDVLKWSVLIQGFEFDGQRIPLVSMQGIFKPQALSLPLSIRTVAAKIGQPRPYEDDLGRDGVIAYRYRGKDPGHPENVGLEALCQLRVPLIYFFGVMPGLYLPVYPVTILKADSNRLTCFVQVDEPERLRLVGERTELEEFATDDGAAERRRYRTATVQVRAHQQSFRARVLQAYREHCAVCRLSHRELLDAAHIIPDSNERGVPEVYNGLALCKLHHAAFDSNFIGIRPSLVIDVREDIRQESDGPMLLHGLQGIHGQKILVPRASGLRPSAEFLDERYSDYLNSAG